MHSQPRGGRGSRGAPQGGGDGGSSSRGGGGADGRGRGRGRGSDRGGRGGDRGGRGHRGDQGGTRGRGGRGGVPARHEADEDPEFHPDLTPAVATPGPRLAPGVATVGVPRPAEPGTSGQPQTVTTNAFKVTTPNLIIHHYDVVVKTDRQMPRKWNYDLIRNLQERIAPDVFTPRAGYDCRKNMYALCPLPLTGGGGKSQTFEVTMEPAREGGRPPKVYKVELKLVAEIDTDALRRYLEGRQSLDGTVLTIIMAINVLLQMDPMSLYTSDGRSFFTNREVRSIGHGIELRRGFTQSIRCGSHSLLLIRDISTGMMYAPEAMIAICHQVLKNNSPNALVPGDGLTDRHRRTLKGFLSGARFQTTHKDKTGQVSKKAKVFKNISALSANSYMFEDSNGNQLSVAQYFHSLGVNLRYPNYACIETSKGAFPIEVCSIIPGQLMRKQPQPDVVEALVQFATKKPQQRLNSIVAAHQPLRYDESEYMIGAGMVVSQGPEKCAARRLDPPAMNYGAQSRSKQIKPRDGAWNLVGQKLHEPVDVGEAWAVVVYDGRNVNQQLAREIVHGLKAQAELLGIQGMNPDPPILFPPAQAMDVHKHLQSAGQEVFRKTKGQAPTLILVVLPDNAADLHRAVKYFGNILRGVPVQCVNGFKSKRGSPQYWANICLKINAKLGGVNTILDPNNQKFISDPANPVMIMGADVSHPAPGARGRPSFASIVGSLDSNAARYSSVTTIQDSRVEIMAEVEDMVYELIGRHAWWKQNREHKKNHFPRRIVYYRDGVSEGQFSQVLQNELPAIKAACKRHKINPAITLVIVGKRHHVRFFPTHGTADRSGNCHAGTVVEDVVGHPTEWDFYLLSHAGILGTSRPAHYNVLHDENRFTVDSMQSLIFALCHLYARSTRSVSIPAPVYYADIECENSKYHFDPSIDFSSVDETATTASGDGGSSAVQFYKDNWKPLHSNMRYKMHFQ